MCDSMQLREFQHGWRSLYISAVQRGLWDHLLFYRRTTRQHWLVGFPAVVLVLAVLLWGCALLRIAGRTRFLLLIGRRATPQIAHARLDLIHQADVFVITHHPRFRGVVRFLQALGAHVHVLQVAHIDRKSPRLNSSHLV